VAGRFSISPRLRCPGGADYIYPKIGARRGTLPGKEMGRGGRVDDSSHVSPW